MAEHPILGQIIMFAGNFAPSGWAFCNGQLLQISQNTALFSLLGTNYGGDGEVTFGLPDLRGRVPVHSGDSTGPGLSPRPLGQKSGVETVTLSPQQIPTHTHTMACGADEQDDTNPAGRYPGMGDGDIYSNANSATEQFGALSDFGGSQEHDNMPPFLAVHFIIALSGLLPS